MDIKVIKIGGEWKVEFSYGNQFFTLEYGGTKAEATWMAKMLRQCFKKYTSEIKQ
jgi:hypothetical protein